MHFGASVCVAMVRSAEGSAVAAGVCPLGGMRAKCGIPGVRLQRWGVLLFPLRRCGWMGFVFGAGRVSARGAAEAAVFRCTLLRAPPWLWGLRWGLLGALGTSVWVFVRGLGMGFDGTVRRHAVR